MVYMLLTEIYIVIEVYDSVMTTVGIALCVLYSLYCTFSTPCSTLVLHGVLNVQAWLSAEGKDLSVI